MRSRTLGFVLSAASAAVGSLGVKPTSAWYRGLDRPSWEPPPVAFPLVWTPLYGLIGWGTGRAMERAEAAGDDAGRRRVLALTVADLAVNAGWCWTFFTGESTRGGLAMILVLDGLNVALLAETARHDRAAAAAIAPYVAWTAFATALNASIDRRNR